ncbi:MAG: DUF167 domain-containing protein [Planctomycetia bacterium]|nr:DUF167 domain-containing protein [Planctomycetia bacterium]
MEEESAKLPFEGTAEGILLFVKGAPGSRKNEIRGVTNGALKVCCTQVPEKGKANKAILEILVKSLRLKKSQISLVAGETDSNKKFLITNLEVAELQSRIESAASEKNAAS